MNNRIESREAVDLIDGFINHARSTYPMGASGIFRKNAAASHVSAFLEDYVFFINDLVRRLGVERLTPTQRVDVTKVIIPRRQAELIENMLSKSMMGIFFAPVSGDTNVVIIEDGVICDEGAG